MDRGALVPDEVILGLIEEVLAHPEAKHGIIMDGFPRTVPQAEAVDRLLGRRDARIDQVLYFSVPEEELVRRLTGRAEQEDRSDDTPEAIERRLRVYREQTEPVARYYRERGLLTEIDGTGSIEDIAQRVERAVGR